MAPVTRRRAKADSSILSEVDSTPAQSQQSTPKAKPAQKLRRKAADTAVDSSKAETPKPNKKLAVRTRIEEDADGDHRHTHIEATLVDAESNEHTARDGSVADSNAEEESDGSAPEPTSASRQLYEEAKLASQSTEPEGDKGAPTPSAAPKGKHVVFGDDDDVEKFVTKAAKAQAARVETAEDEEEESDDDAAPEAVSTSAAAKASQKAEQAAVEAAEKHAATQKRKRQERDALFKEQATERKRTEAETKASTTRQRISKRDLPDELPAEFLEDSSDEEDGADRLQRLKKKRKLFEAEQTAAAELQASKKIKFDEIAEIADKAETEAIRHRVKPRDVALGSTVYRVLAQQGDTRLAPKMHKNSRTVKEDLLRRKREGVTMNKKKGFFVRK